MPNKCVTDYSNRYLILFYLLIKLPLKIYSITTLIGIKIKILRKNDFSIYTNPTFTVSEIVPSD